VYKVLIIVCAAILTAFDQFTKSLAARYLKGGQPIVLWDGVFELHYTENSGAAFGILQQHRIILIIVPLIVMFGICYVLFTEKFGRSWLLNVSGTLIIAGGAGNLIDRIFKHRVVDFFYFKLIDFPIFNVADSFIVMGSIVLLVFFLFVHKEQVPKAPAAGILTDVPANREEDISDEDSDIDTPSGEHRGEA